jgi:hypothetical protein
MRSSFHRESLNPIKGNMDHTNEFIVTCLVPITEDYDKLLRCRRYSESKWLVPFRIICIFADMGIGSLAADAENAVAVTGACNLNIS